MPIEELMKRYYGAPQEATEATNGAATPAEESQDSQV